MAAEISAQLVRELREQTGAGMMDCKRALVRRRTATWRPRSSSCARRAWRAPAKRADRATTEGLVGYRLADDGSRGTMVAVGCETEPVSNNDEFQAYAQEGARPRRGGGHRRRPSSLEDERVELSGEARREHRGRRRGALRGGRRRAPRRVRPPAREQARRPRAAARRRRRARARTSRCTSRGRIRAGSAARTSRTTSSPPSARSTSTPTRCSRSPSRRVRRSSTGMLDKRFFAERGGVLADQPWIHDGSQTVGKVLADAGAEVLEFQRFSLAG